MHIEHLSLYNFRLFKHRKVEFSQGAVGIVGPNASGKTTLLEAIFVASAGRSPRTRKDADLVKWGEKIARVEALFRRNDGRALPVRVAIEILPAGLRKRLWIGEKAIRRSTELLGAIPVVLFTPADLTLAQGEPRVRRRFMNLALARLRPAYVDDLARYRRAVLQRNRLLRDGATPEQIAPWTLQLVENGARVALHRMWFVQALAPYAAEIHAYLSAGREKLEIRYKGDLADAESDFEAAVSVFRKMIAEREAEERLQGRTLVGPHRDDLQLLISGRPVRLYGSQGQQRTAALSLKLAEARLLWDVFGESPLLLLDDCLSELDEARARAVLKLVEHYEQIIVTSASQLPLLVEEEAQIIRLGSEKAGTVNREAQ